MKSKLCNKCKQLKSYNDFHADSYKDDGKSTVCKDCRREYRKKYYNLNSGKAKEYSKEYNNANKEKISIRSKKRYLDNIDEYKKKRKKQYWSNRENNIKKSSEYHLERIKTDSLYRFVSRCRTRTYQSIVGKGYTKRSKTTKLLGCDFDFLINHIESMFDDKMSWDNYGLWHIDHIIPISSGKDENEVMMLCHYLNLQPLWSSDNISKFNNYDIEEKVIMLKRIGDCYVSSGNKTS